MISSFQRALQKIALIFLAPCTLSCIKCSTHFITSIITIMLCYWYFSSYCTEETKAQRGQAEVTYLRKDRAGIWGKVCLSKLTQNKGCKLTFVESS